MPKTAEATVTQMAGEQVKELASLARLMAFASPAKRPRRFFTRHAGLKRTLTGRCLPLWLECILRGLSHDEAVAHYGALRPILSADFYDVQIQEFSKLLDAPGNVSDANCAMMGRSLCVPRLNKAPGSKWKSITAVGVADFEDRARHRGAFGAKQPDVAGVFDDREQRHRPVLNRHFNADAGADLAVKNVEGPDLRTPLGNFRMPRPVMPHQHDIRGETPFEEAIKAMNEALQQGKFKQYGLSNYSASEVQDIIEICERNGYDKPAVFQGHYNAIVRGGEKELFPLLRTHSISFFAYR